MLFSFVLKYFLSPLPFLHWLIVGLSVLRDFHTCVNSPDSLRVWTFHFILLWSGRYCRISTFLTLFRPDSWPRSGAAMPLQAKFKGMMRGKDGSLFMTDASTHWDNVTFRISAHICHGFKYVKQK